MNRHAKPFVALTAGAFLLSGLCCGTAQAQSVLVESGTSILANVFGTSTGSEALSVSWFVVENTTSDLYTYGYNVYNPVGNVVLNNNETPTTTPETFNSFSVSFNVAAITGFFQATPPAGGTAQNNGANGVTFSFPEVTPGNFSPLLAFQTTQAPAMGNASAGGGATPPGPWSSVPDNSPVPVPHQVPEPATTTLLVLSALGLPFRSALRRFVR